MASVEENKALVTRLSEEIWNQGKVELCDDLFFLGSLHVSVSSGNDEAHLVRRARDAGRRPRGSGSPRPVFRLSAAGGLRWRWSNVGARR